MLSLYSPVLWEPLRNSFSVVGLYPAGGSYQPAAAAALRSFSSVSLKKVPTPRRWYVHIRLPLSRPKTSGVYSEPSLFVFLLLLVVYNPNCSQCRKSWIFPFSFSVVCIYIAVQWSPKRQEKERQSLNFSFMSICSVTELNFKARLDQSSFFKMKPQDDLYFGTFAYFTFFCYNHIISVWGEKWRQQQIWGAGEEKKQRENRHEPLENREFVGRRWFVSAVLSPRPANDESALRHLWFPALVTQTLPACRNGLFTFENRRIFYLFIYLFALCSCLASDKSKVMLDFSCQSKKYWHRTVPVVCGSLPSAGDTLLDECSL